ncbi:MAG: dependent protein [Bacillota bacterium]|nr:dependent protein [Bacillota bacterium]MDK2881980.1 dependent protein [Bacillota bacterium]MDK2960066.1 dependent protein [Bacillota bacterium]
MGTVADNVAAVRARVAKAAARSGRRPEDVRLIAVTKNVGPELIKEALAAGITDLGENRVQEAAGKVPVFPEATWHLIGHLQTNKAKQAVRLFRLIHSLDSLRLAETLERRAEAEGCTVKCLVEVNVAGEATKHGVTPEELPGLLKAISAFQHIEVEGLMTVAPYVENPEEVRPVFRRLAELAREVSGLGLPRVNMTELSMGMSGDFEVAVEEGATMVRIGTAIFGPRRQ